MIVPAGGLSELCGIFPIRSLLEVSELSLVTVDLLELILGRGAYLEILRWSI